MNRTKEINQAINIVKEASELAIDLIAKLESPIGIDQTIQHGTFEIKIILTQKVT